MGSEYTTGHLPLAGIDAAVEEGARLRFSVVVEDTGALSRRASSITMQYLP
jgi:hypothetical protein